MTKRYVVFMVKLMSGEVMFWNGRLSACYRNRDDITCYSTPVPELTSRLEDAMMIPIDSIEDLKCACNALNLVGYTDMQQRIVAVTEKYNLE